MRMVKNAWARAEGQRPAMPGDNSRPEPSSRALNTLKPCRVPLVVTAGGWPRGAQVSRNEPHGATLAASAHRRSPCRRLAARQRGGQSSWSQACRRAAAPTPRGPLGTQSPPGAAPSTHTDGWRARRPRARAAPGGGPPATRPSHSPRRAALRPAAPPNVAAGWGATAGGERRRDRRPRCPGRAAARPAARHRATLDGGPSARTTPQRARGGPAGRSRRWCAAPPV